MKIFLFCILFIATSVQAAVWSSPKQLGGLDSRAQRVAMNSKGDVVAVWVYDKGGSLKIQASQKLAGGKWSSPQVLSTPSNEEIQPMIVIDNEHAVAVWQEEGKQGTELKAATLTLGKKSWTPISSPFPFLFKYLPDERDDKDITLKIDEEGSAVLFCCNAYQGLHASRLPLGQSKWAPVEEWPNGGVKYVRFKMDVEGNTVAVWLDGDTPQEAALPKDASSWKQESVTDELVDFYYNQDPFPRRVSDASGNTLVVWEDDNQILASLLPVTGESREPQVLVKVKEPYELGYIYISLSDSGSAVILYTEDKNYYDQKKGYGYFTFHSTVQAIIGTDLFK